MDGPGIRTTVFFKGCPLACQWCHNPESVSFQRELLRDLNTCALCLRCVEDCPEKAIDYNGTFRFSEEKCNDCAICLKSCTTGTLRKTGKYLSPEDLFEILMRDREYYQSSGGGITFSGGEPLMHLDYLSVISQKLKKEGVHIAVQTSGYFNFDQFSKKVLDYIDVIYFDIKLMDKSKHLEYTGKSNELILRNLLRLTADKNVKLIVRTPLIPGKTDSPANLSQIMELIEKLPVDGYETLPFNPV